MRSSHGATRRPYAPTSTQARRTCRCRRLPRTLSPSSQTPTAALRPLCSTESAYVDELTRVTLLESRLDTGQLRRRRRCRLGRWIWSVGRLGRSWRLALREAQRVRTRVVQVEGVLIAGVCRVEGCRRRAGRRGRERQL